MLNRIRIYHQNPNEFSRNYTIFLNNNFYYLHFLKNKNSILNLKIDFYSYEINDKFYFNTTITDIKDLKFTNFDNYKFYLIKHLKFFIKNHKNTVFSNIDLLKFYIKFNQFNNALLFLNNKKLNKEMELVKFYLIKSNLDEITNKLIPCDNFNNYFINNNLNNFINFNINKNIDKNKILNNILSLKNESSIIIYTIEFIDYIDDLYYDRILNLIENKNKKIYLSFILIKYLIKNKNNKIFYIFYKIYSFIDKNIDFDLKIEIFNLIKKYYLKTVKLNNWNKEFKKIIEIINKNHDENINNLIIFDHFKYDLDIKSGNKIFEYNIFKKELNSKIIDKILIINKLKNFINFLIIKNKDNNKIKFIPVFQNEEKIFIKFKKFKNFVIKEIILEDGKKIKINKNFEKIKVKSLKFIKLNKKKEFKYFYFKNKNKILEDNNYNIKYLKKNIIRIKIKKTVNKFKITREIDKNLFEEIEIIGL